LPEATGASPPLDATEQQRVRAFRHEGRQSRVTITSRTQEEWLGDERRVALRGLNRAGAAIMRPYTTGAGASSESDIR
jgi:hypothetical protein